MATGKSWSIAVPITKEGGTWGYITVYFQEEYDAINNTSTLKVTRMTGSNTIRVGTFYTAGNIKINGSTWYSWTTSNWCFGLNSTGTNDFVTYSGATYPSGLVINHDADGSKTITVSVTISNYYGSSPTWYGTGGTVSSSITLTPIPRASSVTAANGTIGSALNIAISKASSSFTHTLKYAFGNVSGTIATKTSASSVSWAPPLSLCGQIPNATSGSCTITCETYSGNTLVGTKTATVSLSVPTSVGLRVSDGWAMAAPYNTDTKASGIDAFVQGYSKAQVTFDSSKISTADAYGATITSYSVGFNGSTIGSPYRTPVLESAGTVDIVCKVTDSRGRTISETLSITVHAYTLPTLSSVSVFRCNSSGIAADEGTYIYAEAVAGCSSIGGLNSVALRVRYRVSGGSYGSYISLTSGTEKVIGDAAISIASTYEAEVSAVDTLGNTITITMVIPTANVFFHGRQGGKGAAFGKYAEEDDLLDVDWNAKIRKKLFVGDGVSIWADDEGGNVEMKAGNGHTNVWQIDAYNGNLRFYTWRESDGTYKGITFNQETGLIEGTNLLNAYPVGAIYMSTESTSPASLFGGTWTKIEGRFLFAANSNYSAGSTGGATTHTLTVNQIPSHTHIAANYMSSVGWSGDSPSRSYLNNNNDGYVGSNNPTTKATGGGAAHNNMPPYLVVYMWKRTA